MNKYEESIGVLRSSFKAKLTRPYAWRKRQLEQLKKFLIEKNDAINEALAKDLRKSAFEAALTEQGIVLGEIEFTLAHLKEWMSVNQVATPLVDWPGSSEIRHEPFGVTLVIGAWNYPVNLLLAPVVGALAGGNAVVIKPSEISAATSAVIAKWIPQYLDPKAVMVVEGGVDDTQALLENEFDLIFFTGSGKVGKIIMSKAAQHLTPVILELGGKSPALVLEDANIQVAAKRIAWGKFMNGGQTCVAPDYILAHSSIKEKLIAELVKAIGTFYGKNPKESKDYCRIVNDRNFQRLEKFLKDGDIVCGGETDAPSRYIAPTILNNVSPTSPIMQEEIFGPILPVLSIRDLDHGIDFINSLPKPLALYLFSKGSNTRERVVEETSSGGICVNDVVMHMASPYLPFGGVGASGMGHYHGKCSFDSFTHQKAVMTKATWIDVPIRYAPYSDAKMKWAKRFI